MTAQTLKYLALIALAFSSASFGASKPVPSKGPTPLPPPPSCSAVSFNIAALSCIGFIEGNLISDGGPKLTQALGSIESLDPNASSLLSKIEWGAGQDPFLIDFNKLLSGKTVIGIHFGGGNTGYNGTGFWLLDLPNETKSITYSSAVQKGISNAGLYLTQARVPGPMAAVPEPANWALLLLGFGMVGGMMRVRRRTQNISASYA